MTTKETVLEAVSGLYGVALEELKPETHLSDDLGGDSLDHSELVLELEEDLEIDIPDEDAVQFRTVGDVIAYCEKKKGA